jgi:hypothetical protein
LFFIVVVGSITPMICAFTTKSIKQLLSIFLMGNWRPSSYLYHYNGVAPGT